jgi:hypothetical protein
MTDIGIIKNKENIFNLLVNMNIAIAKDKLETYGLKEEAKSIKISGIKVSQSIGLNSASLCNQIKIDDIEFKCVKNTFRSKLKKNLRISIA